MDDGGHCDPKFNKRVTTEVVDDFGVNNPVRQIVCNDHGQACMNYRSISNLNADFHTLTCGFTRLPPGATARPISVLWAGQHKPRGKWEALMTAVVP